MNIDAGYLRGKKFVVRCPLCGHEEVCILMNDGDIFSLDSGKYISSIDRETGRIRTLCLGCGRWTEGVYISDIL